VALQAHVLRFDRLSGDERQPYTFGPGSILTWDGRLDNREDLLVTLHCELGEDITDAALVAAAYQRWGDNCFPRLLGDWSLAIWDATQHAVVLARDYMGNRPLYYAEMSGGLAWATCLEALVTCYGLHTDPDDAYIVGHLTFGPTPDRTPFSGARALRGGHALLATRGHSAIPKRYWTYKPARIRYRDDSEYTEHLRHLLTDAVRVRLRAERTVWSHLSGGWDSSSIVCLAHALIRRGRAEAPALQPVAHVVSNSPESDEGRFIAAVERWCNLRAIRREFDGLPTFSELVGHVRPFVALPRLVLESPLREAGDQIVLSGEFGDLIMLQGSAARVSLLEPLHEGHPMRSLRLCAQRAREKHYPLITTLAQLAIEVYLPQQVRTAAALRRQRAQWAWHAARQRPESFAKSLGVTRQVLERAPDPDAVAYPSVFEFPVVKRSLVNLLYRFADSQVLLSSDHVPDIWRTFPYSHRPLVEFVLATPNLAFWDPVAPRAGMRRALQYILPKEILARTTKGNPEAALTRAHRNRADEIIGTASPLRIAENWLLVKRDFVDHDALARALGELKRGDAPLSAFPDQWLHLEAWLQTLDSLTTSRKTAPIPQLARLPG
jgi:asparagine synthetase B (glutamine-hydrolysing)